ncbi:2-iminoacetate synthase ThiH [Natronospora cellulosivora (SeqCode)]
MSFYKLLNEYKKLNIDKVLNKVSDSDVINVLSKDSLSWEDLLVLLSPVAENHLEAMARKARELTIKNFGKVIFLYAPMYLSNYCVNNCSYCGFSVVNKYERKKLSLLDLEQEAEKVAMKGIRDILILTGESRKHSPLSYIKDSVKVLKKYFHSIAIEIYPLKTSEYASLFNEGVDGLTIYQEVYDRKIYDQVHISGPKKDYKFRLEAAERACLAGMRRVNIGALLGLGKWQSEAFYAALHASYLQNKFLGTEFSISVPRLREHIGDYQEKAELSDRNLVQIILAFRLFLPRVGINLSTRESASFRDNVLPLGITKMSAESTTVVGGYSSDDGFEQFAIADNRKVDEVKTVLLEKGYQGVFKDWHQL